MAWNKKQYPVTYKPLADGKSKPKWEKFPGDLDLSSVMTWLQVRTDSSKQLLKLGCEEANKEVKKE
jgi:hypothetical protein